MAGVKGRTGKYTKTHEHIRKIIKSRGSYKGIKNPNYGKKHSEETKRKIGLKSKERGVPKSAWKKGDTAMEKNPNWKGGKSFELYPPEFNKELKTKIRKKYKFQCQTCFKNGFDVHHIDADKKNCSEENLIVLCRSCHAKITNPRGWTT